MKKNFSRSLELKAKKRKKKKKKKKKKNDEKEEEIKNEEVGKRVRRR